MTTLTTYLTTALIVVGVFFLSVGTIGLLRLPNVYNRMHATSKSTTLGTASIFLAGFVEFGPGGSGLPSLIGIVFLFLTVPTGSHMIARSAERLRIPFEDSVSWPAKVDRSTDGSAREGGTGDEPAGEE
jgi:multicomponent Na+:H+ antiporter subunit G